MMHDISQMCILTIKALMESEEFGWLFNDPVDPVELGEILVLHFLEWMNEMLQIEMH